MKLPSTDDRSSGWERRAGRVDGVEWAQQQNRYVFAGSGLLLSDDLLFYVQRVLHVSLGHTHLCQPQDRNRDMTTKPISGYAARVVSKTRGWRIVAVGFRCKRV
jgi:hypothetical protein